MRCDRSHQVLPEVSSCRRDGQHSSDAGGILCGVVVMTGSELIGEDFLGTCGTKNNGFQGFIDLFRWNACVIPMTHNHTQLFPKIRFLIILQSRRRNAARGTQESRSLRAKRMPEHVCPAEWIAIL